METLKLVSEPIGLFAYCWEHGGLGPRNMLVVKKSFQTIHISKCLHFNAHRNSTNKGKKEKSRGSQIPRECV